MKNTSEQDRQWPGDCPPLQLEKHKRLSRKQIPSKHNWRVRKVAPETRNQFGGKYIPHPNPSRIVAISQTTPVPPKFKVPNSRTLATLNPTTLALRAGSHGSQVLSPKSMRSIHAISTVERMEVGTYHFTRVPSPKSQLWYGCLHGNTFWRWGLGLVLRVESSKKLDPTLKPSPANILLKIIKIWL